MLKRYASCALVVEKVFNQCFSKVNYFHSFWLSSLHQ